MRDALLTSAFLAATTWARVPSSMPFFQLGGSIGSRLCIHRQPVLCVYCVLRRKVSVTALISIRSLLPTNQDAETAVNVYVQHIGTEVCH